MALSRKNRNKKSVSRKSRRSQSRRARRYRHRGGAAAQQASATQMFQMAAQTCASQAQLEQQIQTMTQQSQVIKQACTDQTAAAQAAAAAEAQQASAAQAAQRASATQATKSDSGKKVNLYFNASYDQNTYKFNPIPKNFYPVYSDYDGININDLVTQSENETGTVVNRKIGFKFPARNIFVKDISFETRGSSDAPWSSIQSNRTANLCVNDETSIIMRYDTNNYISGSGLPINRDIKSTTFTPCTNYIKYPKEGINLNNVTVLGWGNTWGFIGNLQSGYSKIPAGAPAGTPSANLRMSFTIV
jgi:hypothetical protein